MFVRVKISIQQQKNLQISGGTDFCGSFHLSRTQVQNLLYTTRSILAMICFKWKFWKEHLRHCHLFLLEIQSWTSWSERSPQSKRWGRPREKLRRRWELASCNFPSCRFSSNQLLRLWVKASKVLFPLFLSTFYLFCVHWSHNSNFNITAHAANVGATSFVANWQT